MKKTINVEATYAGMRIDRFLRKYFESIPQSLIEKSLRSGKIKLNKKKIKSSVKLQLNDLIELHNFKIKKEIITKKVKFKPSDTIIKENENFIIENNEDFVVLNKQAGISVQGGTKSKKNLIDIFSKSEIFKEDKPYSVHRLDKETSGIFLIAKNRPTAQLLTTLFRLRKVYKTYIAICHGEITIKDKGLIKNNLIRYDETRKIVENAETHYEILDKNNNSTFIQLKPITGRKHQLRKQLFNIGHPVVGDEKYSLKNEKNGKNLLLHAYKIKFMINKIKYNFKANYGLQFENFVKKNIKS